MTDHPYDPDLPYVVEADLRAVARFCDLELAREFVDERVYSSDYSVIDTTPKPRVPEDAKIITWWDKEDLSGLDASNRWYAARFHSGWLADDGALYGLPDDLPGVTPDTVFTVLDERKTDD